VSKKNQLDLHEDLASTRIPEEALFGVRAAMIDTMSTQTGALRPLDVAEATTIETAHKRATTIKPHMSDGEAAHLIAIALLVEVDPVMK
jgi:hypothetical protein